MPAQTKSIFFFIRAYNDLDIQLSLIRLFAADERFDVRVLFYPADGFNTHHKTHEATDYMQDQYGVVFENILQQKACPFWLKTFYSLHWRIRQMRKAKSNVILKVIDVALSKLMKPALSKKSDWLIKAQERWNPDIIITDEILFQAGRAPLIDVVVPQLMKKSAATYSFLTGHRVYLDVHPAGESRHVLSQASGARAFFVPSQHNKTIYDQIFPNENIVVGGNLRFDRDWISELHRHIVPKANLPEKPVKIVIMLSKMNYGVEADQIINTIRTLGYMEHVALAVKPHTRGMKFDFMSKDEIGDTVIVSDIPSTALIEWGDIILMTGSSIIFHAMVLGKVTGFLKYCQNLETIFDDAQACETFGSLDQLISYIENFKDTGQASNHEDFITHEIHGGLQEGLTAQHNKDLILEDFTKFLASR